MNSMAPSYIQVGRETPTTATAVLATRQSLWLGDDHLLAVTRHAFSEEYKRFRYADVEALVLQEHDRFLRIGWTGVLATLFLLILSGTAFVLGWPPWLLTALGILSAAAVAVWVLSAFAGPPCICLLRTAVQDERLFCIARWRTATRDLTALVERIEQAQAAEDADDDMVDEDVDAPQPKTAEAAPAGLPEPIVATYDITRPEQRRYEGLAHDMLFVFLLAAAAADIFYAIVPTPWMAVIGLLIRLGVAGTAVHAIYRQTGTTLTVSTKAMTWAIAILLPIDFSLRAAYTLFDMYRTGCTASYWHYLDTISATRSLQFTSRAAIARLIAATVTAGVAVAGLIVHHRAPTPQEAPPTEPDKLDEPAESPEPGTGNTDAQEAP